ncbi:MAG: hypothetical protein FWF76_03775 [Oscillospiraceae bacterium]|nr:hypothetical protein [Oscillospiraceae bacterium]
MKKTKFLAILVCLVIFLSLVACSANDEVFYDDEIGTNIEDTIEDNEEEIPAEPEPKIVGSRGTTRSASTGEEHTTLEAMIEDTATVTNRCVDLNGDPDVNVGKIVIGRVESVEISQDFWYEGENPCPIDDFYDTVSNYTVTVYETLLGEETDTVVVAMLGYPDSHIGMTKPDIGDKLLLFLWQGASGRFGTIQFEESVFRIEEDGTLFSFSDMEFTAQFDGETLEVLEDEILEILEDIETDD